MTSTGSSLLRDIDAYIFDVFGTVVNLVGTIGTAIKETKGDNEDWYRFAHDWDVQIEQITNRVASGSEGSLDIDKVHREALDTTLKMKEWSHLNWAEDYKDYLIYLWHKLDAWPDSSSGLHELKKNTIIATISNGGVKCMIDIAKHADLPWDAIFGGQLLGSFKPNPKMYLGAAQNLCLPPERIAMVAAHMGDIRGAARHGMRTVYVRRPTEDLEERDNVKPKSEGGEVDIVVDSLVELAQLINLKASQE